MKVILIIQSLIYNLNLKISKFLSKINSSSFQEADEVNNELLKLSYNNKIFFYPKRNENKYNIQNFKDLRDILSLVLNKKNFPEYFIDIGAYIGLYTFIINEIYNNIEKKINLYSFEPTKYAFELLNKNKIKQNSHTLFNLGIFNKNMDAVIAAPSFYYSKNLSSHLKKTYKSMKSLNEKGGIDSEKIKLVKLNEILEKKIIENSYIKIDVEGSEVEILDYLDKNSLYPEIISAELNNHYIYKRYLTIEKIFNYNFQKTYSFYIVEKINSNKLLKEVSVKELQKIIVLGNKNSIFKKYTLPKVFAMDIYLIKKQ